MDQNSLNLFNFKLLSVVLIYYKTLRLFFNRDQPLSSFRINMLHLCDVYFVSQV